MIFKEKNFRLKNGDILAVREAQIEDAANLRFVIKEYIEESEFVPYVEDEYQMDVKAVEEWVQSFLDQRNSILLLAIVNGKIVGNITANGKQREVLKHTSILGIGLLKLYRSLGIGTILFQQVIDWAKANPIIEQLGLETYHDNELGIKLYERFRFQLVGNQKDFVKMPDGSYRDNLIMTLKIK